MSQQHKKNKRQRRTTHRHIKITERMRIVEKNDNTRVAKPDTIKPDTISSSLPVIRTVDGRPPANMGPTFRIKMRKK